MASPRSPLSPRPPPSPSQDDTEAWRAKFVHFYQTNAPSKAKFVNDKMMAKWKGKYKELYSNLERKYGPLGAPSSPPRPPSRPGSGGSRPGSGRAFGGRGKRTVADLSSEFEALVNKARRECPDNKAPSDLVDAKLTAAENGLETSTFTVCARIRPKLPQDQGDEDFVCVVPGEHGRAARCLVPRVSITGRPKLDEARSELDYCWGPSADEDNIFDSVGRPLVHRALDGQVGVIFAYGQTGSGKTHTMSNLMERVVGELFKSGAAANVMRHRKISFSYCEILGSDANDCLSPSHDAVKIGEMLDGRVVLKNLSEHEVEDAAQMHALVKKAAATRSTESTARNDTSSRSHGIGIVTVAPPEGCALAGKLYVIDLAGSERAADSKDHDQQRLEETKAINISLMALKECIRARTKASRPGAARSVHIPYRRAKLTQVMKDVFDVASPRLCATVVLACVAPTARDVDHSKNTLSYAAPLKVAVEAAPHLQRDDRDPALWATAQLIEWVAATAPCTEQQAKQIVNQNTGVQFCAVSESALFARCAAAELDAKQSKKLYGALWTAVIDAKTRNRRPDGTITTEEDEAREKAAKAQALKDKAALWKEREKTLRSDF